MLIKLQIEIEKGWYEDQEELNSVKRIRKKELAALVGQRMLDMGLIKVTEKTGVEKGDIVLQFETCVLNPEQLQHINSMLHVLTLNPTGGNVGRIMNEIENR